MKRILGEKIEDGHEISYLIDWDDNPETGESYTPTWVWISTSRSHPPCRLEESANMSFFPGAIRQREQAGS